MGKQANYITKIEIGALWNGGKRIAWNLKPDVNILSGVNGIGKSTILNMVVRSIEANSDRALSRKAVPGVTLGVSPEDATFIKFDFIRSFDRQLVQQEVAEKIAEKDVRSELDFQIYTLQRRYLDYQVKIGNRIIKMLTTGGEADKQKATEISRPRTLFNDIIDELFLETDKTIIRDSNEICFRQNGERLSPYKLSSGEKQILIILLTALVEDNERYVLFMDEPEISLHIEWQQRLIELIRQLNPNAQIILTTHSPAMIMNGWVDAVTEVSDIAQ